jgi:copper chaperone CopZ
MTNTVTIKLSGLDCASCVINIDGSLEDSEGIIEARTDYANERAVVTFDASIITEQRILSIIKGTGYEAALIDLKH